MRQELHPSGLEVVTVALDLAGMDHAGRWIEAAQPEHPSLIDQAHVMDELFGVVNVPNGIWIDEEGVIVRPPEPAFPGRSMFADMQIPGDMDQYLADVLREAKKIRHQPDKYVGALRDWVERGSESRYALTPAQVVERSQPRPAAAALAAAHFEMAQHLHRLGHRADAVPHFREAHRLAPENWTYKRQAWSMAHPFQGPSEDYESDWLSDVRKIGAENYYPPLDM